MSIVDSVKMAFSSLFAHKMRSLLTMLGIIIAVTSIITIVAIGQGGEAALKSSFAGNSNHSLDIQFQYFETEETAETATKDEAEVHFNESDVFDLQQIPGISTITMINTSQTMFRYRDQIISAQLNGISEGYYIIP